jgi:hypothetical protein
MNENNYSNQYQMDIVFLTRYHEHFLAKKLTKFVSIYTESCKKG